MARAGGEEVIEDRAHDRVVAGAALEGGAFVEGNDVVWRVDVGDVTGIAGVEVGGKGLKEVVAVAADESVSVAGLGGEGVVAVSAGNVGGVIGAGRVIVSSPSPPDMVNRMMGLRVLVWQRMSSLPARPLTRTPRPDS